MAISIVPANFSELSKEFKTDEEGKGYVSRRGLARLCGVSNRTWGQGGSKFSVEIDQYLTDGGFEVGVVKSGCSIPDLIAAEVIGFYDSEKQNPVAKKSSRAFRAIGLRALIQNATGYKPPTKRKLTAEEIIEVCCLPVPTTWERRFPEEKFNSNTKTRFLTLVEKRVYDIMRVSDFLNTLISYHDKTHRFDWAKVWKTDSDFRGKDARICKEWLVLSM